MQRYDLCVDQTTAKLMLMYEDEGQNEIVQSHAYGEVVHKIAAGVEDPDVSAELLLRVAKLELVTLIKGKNIIRTTLFTMLGTSLLITDTFIVTPHNYH